METSLEIDGEVRVVTANSVWLIRSTEYCRMPRTEAPRSASAPTMTDSVWHEHVGAWLVLDASGPYIRLLPPGRPAGAHGVLTSRILETEPADLVRAAARRRKL
jgi:hypothetical protein